MRRFFPLTLVLAALSAPLRAADGDADDKAIRDLTQRIYAAIAAKDLDAYMALWSDKSPDYETGKKTMAALFDQTGRILVPSLEVVRVRRDGDAASVRVRVHLVGDDVKTGKPHPALGELNQSLDLARADGRWSIMHVVPSDLWLLRSLLQARTKGERLRLLDDDTDLVGSAWIRKALHLSESLSDRGDFPTALYLQRIVLEVAEGLGDEDAVAWCWLSAATCFADQALLEQAEETYQEALRRFRDAHDREGEAAALGGLGSGCVKKGAYTEALQYFQSSYSIANDLGDRDVEAHMLNNMGIICDETGRYPEALRHYGDSLKIYRDLDDLQGQCQTLSNVGSVYASTGRYGEALRQFKDSLKIARDWHDRRGEARALNNIGVVYQKIGLYAEAAQQFQDSLQIKRDLNDRYGEALTLTNLGIDLGMTGDFQRALQSFQDSLQIARDLDNRTAEAKTLTNIGNVYYETGRYKEARRRYQDGLEIMRDLGDSNGEAQALNNMGSIDLDTGRYADARQELQRGLELAESIDDPDIAYACHINLGRMYRVAKQWSDAARAYRDAVGLTERLRTNTREPSLQSSLLAERTDPFFRLAQCQLELQEPAKAFAAGEQMKARGLVDILQQGKAELRRGMSNDERKEEQRLQDQLTALGVQLEDLRSRKADADRQTALTRDLDQARQDYDAFRRDLYLHRSDLQTRRAEFAPASLDALSRSLFAGRPGQLVLSYLVGGDETLLFVLTAADRDGGPARLTVHRIDVGAKDLAEAVESFREGCSDPGKGEPDSDDLYRWLIAPAADELKDAKQVVVVPDGVLHTLPFQALRDPDGKYLIERFAVSYAPSVTALTKMEELGAKRRQQYAGQPPSLLAVGVSDFGHREKTLPAAENEARDVAAGFGAGAKLLPGVEATRARLEASWGSCRYLHFATHGRLNPDAPLYSSLVLSPDGDEGVLYARDLLDADVPAELVVMSACHTGEGRNVAGEGLLGMSWSWFAAGVPSVVASQWSVGDASTARLMKVFYARLRAGDSKAEALRQAELSLLADPSTHHPFFWAPFVLVGDDR